MEGLREALRRRGLTVFGLAGPGGSLAGWDSSGDLLTGVRVRYGEADRWLVVETGRRDGTILLASPLREVIEHHLRRHGVRFADLDWVEEPAELEVDGRVLRGRRVRAGADWWAARVGVGAAEVTLMAYRWGVQPAVRALAAAEVEALIAAPRPRPEVDPPRPEPLPAGMRGEPHRALVDLALRGSRANQEWLREGGPVPRMPGYWGELWAAVVRRQSDLAGQTGAEASAAVSVMVEQLTRLQAEAAWFREDAALRERAIAETLIWSTGLSDTVPSRAAQRAWRRRIGAEVSVAAQRSWIEEWHAWALRR